MNVMIRSGGLLLVLLTTMTLVSCSSPTGGTAVAGSAVSTATGNPAGHPPPAEPSAATPPSAPTAPTTAPAASSGPTAESAPGATPPRAAASAETNTATATVTVTTAAPDVPAPVIPPTDLSGQVYGFIHQVDVAHSTITLDKIDWFTGAAAQKACAEDGITSTDNNRCTGYYYRNVNPALRVVAVSPNATIFTLRNGTNAVQSDLGAVAGRIATSGGQGNTYQLVVTDGVVTDLREMYHP